VHKRSGPARRSAWTPGARLSYPGSDRYTPMTGQILSHYRIGEKLGAGGMGVVYKAEDIRLGRSVAVKFLPEELLKDPIALERFQREARVASSLNHPNICIVYDIGEAQGRPFLVMEYLEGQTLRQVVSTRRLTIEEVLEWGTQIADALDAAHTVGIAHRDIKTTNIFITTRRIVKVMDFGLAKRVAGRLASDSPAHPDAPTVAIDPNELTSPGSWLGTVGYVSPEQARGEKLDPRTDLFSLGVVLYEMATGVTPFSGNTSAVVFDAILNRQPVSPFQLRPELPAQLEQVISMALEKDREIRCQTAGEMRAALQRVRRDLTYGRAAPVAEPPASSTVSAGEVRMPIGSQQAPVHPAQPAPAPAPAPVRRRWPWVAASLAVAAALGLALYLWLIPKPPPFQRMQITRLTTSGKATAAAISPDGRYVVHVVSEAGQQSLWIRQVHTSSNVQIAPPASARYTALSFSRDGNSLFYVLRQPGSPSTLYEMPVLGGAAKRVISDVEDGVTFSPDGKQLAFVRYRPNLEAWLMVASADGSGERKIAARIKPENFEPGVAWSPDGKLFACPFGMLSPQRGTVMGVQVDGGPEKPLSSDWWWKVTLAAWLPDGRGMVLNVQDPSWAPGQIWYLSYPAGRATRITNDLSNYVGLSLTADSSALATIQSDQVSNIWMAPKGDAAAARPITSGSNRYDGTRGLSWTPDGNLLFASRTSGNHDIWMMGPNGTSARQLTAKARTNVWPRACADGRYIVFYSDRTGTLHIWRMDADGSNPKQLTFGRGETLPDCTQDGRAVVYTSVTTPPTIWKVSLDGGEPVPLTTTASVGPAVSPDGKWLAYEYQDEKATPAMGIAVMPLEGRAPIRRFEAPGRASRLAWAPDSAAILYVREPAGVSNIWRQALTGGPPQQMTSFPSDQIFAFEWSKDGKQLALARGSENKDVVLISDQR